MKKAIYALALSLVVAGGLVFANRDGKKDIPKKATPRPLTAAEMEAEKKKWEATPAGIKYKQWEASPIGTKVLDDAGKVRKQINASENMAAVITALSLPPGSRLGFGVMARIDGTDYIVTFEPEKSQLAPLQSLKVGNKLMIQGHGVSFAPKYSYAIVAVEYAERDSKMIFKHAPREGC